MKIKDTNGAFFYFKLDDDDWQKYGYINCRKFFNHFKKNIESADRKYIKNMNAWMISGRVKTRLMELLQQHFDIEKQKNILNDL